MSTDEGRPALPSKKPKADNVAGIAALSMTVSDVSFGAAELATAAAKHARNGRTKRISGRWLPSIQAG